MKKVYLLILGLLLTQANQAQDITDAVRYGLDEIQGTARFRAMGGAFGALGGDMSALSLNPAGSVIFSSSAAAFTIGWSQKNNDVSYGNGFTSTNDDNFNFAQGGAVFLYGNSNPNSKWNKFALGINYERTSDFNDNWVASGVNNVSIGEYFSGFANGLPLGEISALDGETLTAAYADIGASFGFGHQQAFLGFESVILQPADINNNDNTVYTSNIADGTFNQRYLLSSTGYNGKMAFNFAAQYDDRISFGANINAHFLNYERVTVFDESNSNAGSRVNNVAFDNTLFTTGAGISFQLGTIFKVTEEFRLGLNYNSPTWYRINEETTQFIQTTGTDPNDAELPFTFDPRIINIYPEYRLQTPGKIGGSLAYVFGDKGLLSFDYSRRDFGNMEFRPTSDPFFAQQNAEMSNLLGVANTYRFGGELRHKQFSFRGGYRIEESPYENDAAFGDLTAYSLGLGYKLGNLSFDLAFTQAERETSNLLYSNAPTFNEAANVDTRFTDIVFTLAFSL